MKSNKTFLKELACHLGFDDAKIVHFSESLRGISLVSSSKPSHMLGFISSAKWTHMAELDFPSMELVIPVSWTDDQALECIAGSILSNRYSAICIICLDNKKSWQKISIRDNDNEEAILLKADMLNV